MRGVAAPLEDAAPDRPGAVPGELDAAAARGQAIETYTGRCGPMKERGKISMGVPGPINDALRFPDEPVRHKILDMIGDLYLLGRRLQARVVARMTGHTQNIAVLKKVRESL